MTSFGERLSDLVGDPPLRENDATFADGWREAKAMMSIAADESYAIHDMHSITLDATAQMMVSLLRETIAEEPPVADPDVHLGEQAAELAMNHYQWSRRVDACYLMTSSRLRGLIEDQLLK